MPEMTPNATRVPELRVRSSRGTAACIMANSPIWSFVTARSTLYALFTTTIITIIRALRARLVKAPAHCGRGHVAAEGRQMPWSPWGGRMFVRPPVSSRNMTAAATMMVAACDECILRLRAELFKSLPSV